MIAVAYILLRSVWPVKRRRGGAQQFVTAGARTFPGPEIGEVSLTGPSPVPGYWDRVLLLPVAASDWELTPGGRGYGLRLALTVGETPPARRPAGVGPRPMGVSNRPADENPLQGGDHG